MKTTLKAVRLHAQSREAEQQARQIADRLAASYSTDLPEAQREAMRAECSALYAEAGVLWRAAVKADTPLTKRIARRAGTAAYRISGTARALARTVTGRVLKAVA